MNKTIETLTLAAMMFGAINGAVAQSATDIGDVVVGFKETEVKTVAQGSESNVSGVVRMAPGGELVKGGEGTLTVPMANIDTKGTWNATVQKGTLELTGGVDNSIADNTAFSNEVALNILTQKAAFWLDASQLTEGSEVSTWADCRGGTGRYSATVAYKNVPSDMSQTPPIVVVTNGVKGVYFGGKSGKYMSFTEISDVHNYFIVHAPIVYWNSLLGHSSVSRGYGMMSGLSGNADDAKNEVGVQPREKFAMYGSSRGDFQGMDFGARFFLDGERCSPWQQYPKGGLQLFESDQLQYPQQFDALMYNHTEAEGDYNVPGGDYIFEVAIFAKPLSEAERLEVEHYLMRKWNLPQSWMKDENGMDRGIANRAATGNIDTALGTTVEINVEADKRSVPVALAGSGTINKTGDGMLVTGPTPQAQAFNGTFTLDGGSVLIKGGACPPIAVSAGETWDVSRYPTSMYSDEQMLNSGARVSKTASSGSTVTKTGDHELKVSKVNGGVKRIEVQNGTFNLAATEAPVETVDSELEEVEVPIKNHSFENYFGEIDSYCRKSHPTELKNQEWMGWYGPASQSHEYFTTYSGNTTWSKFPVPDGTNAMIVGFSAANTVYSYTKVNLPRAGEYEFSFMASSRYEYHNVTTKTDGSTYDKREPMVEIYFNGRVVGIVRATKGAWAHYRVRFTADASDVGSEKNIGFKLMPSILDTCFLVDDVHLKAVAVPKRQDVVKVPGGDFEDPDKKINDTWHLKYVTSTYCPTNWTFTVSELGGTVYPETNDYIGVVNSAMTSYDPRYTYVSTSDKFTINWRIAMYPEGDKNFGSQALAFFGNYGTAESATFSLPKGRWILRAKLWKRTYSLKSNPSDTEKGFIGESKLTAKLSRSAGQFNLGTVTALSHNMRSYVWPNVFEVTSADGEAVSLILNGGSTSCAGVVDDLEFVPAEGSLGDVEFLSDGSNEINGLRDWVKSTYPSTTQYHYIKTWDWLYSDRSYAFGMTTIEGNRNLQILNNDDLSKDLLTIPEPGLYRLTLHLRRRTDDQGHYNPFLAYIVEDDETNVIMRINSPVGQDFVEYSRLFRIKHAGTIRLHLAGEGWPSGNIDQESGKDKADRSLHIDNVSVTKVDETKFTKPIMSQDVAINVAANTLLALDYPGTNVIRSLNYNGKKLRGVIDAKTHPEFVHGIGTLYIPKIGNLIIWE